MHEVQPSRPVGTAMRTRDAERKTKRHAPLLHRLNAGGGGVGGGTGGGCDGGGDGGGGDGGDGGDGGGGDGDGGGGDGNGGEGGGPGSGGALGMGGSGGGFTGCGGARGSVAVAQSNLSRRREPVAGAAPTVGTAQAITSSVERRMIRRPPSQRVPTLVPSWQQIFFTFTFTIFRTRIHSALAFTIFQPRTLVTIFRTRNQTRSTDVSPQKMTTIDTCRVRGAETASLRSLLRRSTIVGPGTPTGGYMTGDVADCPKRSTTAVVMERTL